MKLNRLKSEGLFIGRRATQSTPPAFAVHADETDPVRRAAARLVWKRPGEPLCCIGQVVGALTTPESVWTDMLTKMHDRLLRWSRVRLGYRGRVLVVKTLVTSLAWYTASLWQIPETAIPWLALLWRAMAGAMADP